MGTLRLPSGSTYKGEWKNGDRDGRGYLVFVNPSSSYYDGEFKAGKRHGKGLCVWVAGQWKGDRYFGDWENDCIFILTYQYER
jgi:radial spoke head protein 1